MKKLLSILFFLLCLSSTVVLAQSRITGKVTSGDDGQPLPGVTIKVKGSNQATQSGLAGDYSINAKAGQTLVFSFVGYFTQEKPVTADGATINVQMGPDSKNLNEVVVTALGQTTQKRTLGTSQQTVKGADIANTQRENFINSLQGRVAGVEVTSSSGVPGASSSITIRGVSSISGSNQPLFVVDGLPIDNKTISTAAFASDAPGSTTAFSNRGLDFSNRGADINPEDIESVVVLKGPEAAALYGIDAGNGAIVITTKRGKAGTSQIDYSNSFRVEMLRKAPEIQNVYGLGVNGSGNVLASLAGGYEYFGPEWAAGTKFYDNVGNFFKTGFTQHHNLSASGGTNNINYRLSASYVDQNGVVPNSQYKRLNITGASQAIVNKWLKTDLTMTYSNSSNDQPLKGSNGPLLALLSWPRTDDAQNYLNPSGTRRTLGLIGTLGLTELDNPYFSINKNINNTKNDRITTNVGLTITPFKWLNFKTNMGIDAYTTRYMVMRHPESASGYSRNGILDVLDDMNRNFTMQNLLNLTPQTIAKGLKVDATLGNSLLDWKSTADAGYMENFLDPNFVSLNNGAPGSKNARTTITQRRLASFFGKVTFNYNDYLYVTGTLRNDRTSTIPFEGGRYSFYYPSVSTSFVFTDAFKGLRSIFTSGKIRAAFAAVGKDTKPYAYKSTYESKSTVGGGYGYGFTGDNPTLKPEFAKSFEVGTELSFLNDRLGLDLTLYRKTTSDQITNDLRFSYATGFILFNRNGAKTLNKGIELTLRGTPFVGRQFSWNVLANFFADKGIVTALPAGVTESYSSDTYLYNSIRNGVILGSSTRNLTGTFYIRNNAGQILINPTTGLPVRSTVNIAGGYDRNPNFSIGLTNNFTYKTFSLSFLLDMRKGGDVFNATEHYLTTLGLSTQTLDRTTPRVIQGVLQDGRENSANPTPNNIVITPNTQNTYYTSMSEELFIQKRINWIRLKDVTLSYRLPDKLIKRQNFVKNASVFLTGTDLFILTNYKGLDPIVSGNTAAVGGSGGQGIDFGNFPIPIGINFGVKVSL
ncbi:SusC/RagA family TonB-linked outer membrane protein [Mucilaginibacter daejeonensis]|uniref:SusC/RagA family TonB-linked outer membrane protein n=1 Tax=Mucilaginibacter daejeonensis TaxID=398049 RepID=UPI001D170936|nr:SusC/RagA family TonB-linked outer membrane protein [Mucilaginibacter daejeonensis]UEG51638.1 SusC/RagA family TonB-linked outer membrane protein [Mucilaginibacter daejeonensis]